LLEERVRVGGVEHVAHVLAVDALGVVGAHARHEEREGGDDAEVREERQADVAVRALTSSDARKPAATFLPALTAFTSNEISLFGSAILAAGAGEELDLVRAAHFERRGAPRPAAMKSFTGMLAFVGHRDGCRWRRAGTMSHAPCARLDHDRGCAPPAPSTSAGRRKSQA